jgi:hypothetical protein
MHMCVYVCMCVCIHTDTYLYVCFPLSPIHHPMCVPWKPVWKLAKWIVLTTFHLHLSSYTYNSDNHQYIPMHLFSLTLLSLIILFPDL